MDLYLEIVHRFLDLGHSATRICEDLNREGRKGKRGKKWVHGTLCYILRNSCYVGRLYANRYIFEGKKRVGEKPRDEWIEFRIPPAISEERWQAIQRRLRQLNCSPGKKPKTGRYLLRDHLECGICGSSMYAQRGVRPQDLYYCCHNRRTARAFKRTTPNGERCSLPYISMKEPDRMVFNYLIRVVAEPDLISQFAAEAVSEKQEIELLTKQAKVERHIKQLESKQERFLDLYADGRIEKKALYSKVDDLETALSHAREEATQVNEALMGMKEARRQQARVKEALEQIQPFGEELSKRAEKMSFDEKRAVIKFFLKDTKIKVHGIQQIGKKRLPFITFDSMFDFDHLQEIAKDSGAGRSLLEALGDPISFFDGSSRSVSRASASGGRKTRLADGRRMAAPTHPGQDRGNLLLYACLHLV